MRPISSHVSHSSHPRGSGLQYFLSTGTLSLLRCFTFVTFLQSLKWVNRHGTACTCLALLLVPLTILHLIAVAAIGILQDIPQEYFSARLVRNMAGIQFFQANWWFAALYLLFFFGLLIYMEIRSIPRWAVWCVFLFLSLPIFGYMLACIRVSFGFIHGMGPAIQVP
jgi:hypothetical protein